MRRGEGKTANRSEMEEGAERGVRFGHSDSVKKEQNLFDTPEMGAYIDRNQ